jgi:hypothetical protein
MPSFFSRFVRIGRLPEPLRATLEPEGIIHVAERVRVRQRFSGSAPGVHSSSSVNRQIGLWCSPGNVSMRCFPRFRG